MGSEGAQQSIGMPPTRGPEPRPRWGRALGAATVVIALVGGFAFFAGRTTSSPSTRDTVAEPPVELVETTTSTTFAPAPEPPAATIGTTTLSWERASADGDLSWLHGVVSLGDRYLAVGTAGGSGRFGIGRSVVLESTDGRTWDQLVAFPEGAAVPGLQAIAGGEHGIVVAGLEFLEPVPDDFELHYWAAPASQPVAYTTTDGLDWSRIVLDAPAPEITSPFARSTTHVMAAAAGNGVTVLFGSATVEPDFGAILEAHYGEPVDPSQIGGWGFDGRNFEIFGPGNIIVDEINLEDLGADPETRAVLAGGVEERPVAWVSTDLVTFERIEPEGLGRHVYITGSGTMPDGSLYITGHGHSGPTVWTSVDGRSWEIAITGGYNINSVLRFGDGWLGFGGYPRPQVRSLAEGGDWETVALDGLLPDDDRTWHFGTTQTGGLGVAAEVSGYLAEYVEFRGPPPIVVESDGLVVSIDMQYGRITVERDGETLLSSPTNMSGPTSGVEVDVAGQRYLFTDPETGEQLATVSFDEVRTAQGDAYGGLRSDQNASGVVFSEDGSEWSFQPASGIVGEGTIIRIAHVGNDFALAVVHRPGDPLSDEPLPAELWVGTLPGR